MPRIDLNAQLLWLILPLALVLAPHALALPIWITLSWLIFALLSLRSAPVNRAWPGWLKMLLAVAGVAGVLLQFGTVIGPTGGVALLIYLSGAKLLETRSARDRLGLLFIGFFLLVAYFLNSQSMAMAAYMTLVAIALVAAMIANLQPSPTIRASLGLAGRLLLQALPLALLLFLLFPRIQNPLWGLPQQGAAQTGLSDRMSPGDFSQLSLSNEIAFRVEFSAADGSQPSDPSELYWRGPVLWDFDGRTWKNRAAIAPTPVNAESRGQPIQYTITLEPHRQRWLFLLGLPFEIPPRLPHLESTLGADLQWLSKAPISQRTRYSVTANLNYQLDPSGLDHLRRERTLALPEGNPQARQLARQWRDQTPSDRAVVDQALAFFRSEAFYYTLNPPQLGQNSIDAFLFDSRRGFCEHYASAFVFLMRAAGIPARVVTGYQGGELNPLGNYWIVRQRDAHAWAEVWLAGTGWSRIDPTGAVAPNRVERGLNAALPIDERREGLMTLNAGWLLPVRLTWDLLNNQWNQWVLGYNQDRQRQLLARLSPYLATWQGMAWGLAAAGGVLLIFMAALFIPRLASVKTDPASRLYARFCQSLARQGLRRGVSEGPSDFAQRAISLRPDLAVAIDNITRLYLAVRYGNAESAQLATDASLPVRHLAELKRAVREFKPRHTMKSSRSFH